LNTISTSVGSIQSHCN